MKKIISPIIIAVPLFAFDIGSLVSNSNLLGESDLGKVVGSCYEVESFNITDMCSSLDFHYNESVDICSLAPEITGLKKKTNMQIVGAGTSSLYDYCNSSVDKTKTVVSQSELWTVQNDNNESSLTFPSGFSMEDFYSGNEPILNVEDLVEQQDSSLAAKYYSSTNTKYSQQTAKYLIDIAKTKKGVTNVTEITSEDIGVAEDMIQYEKQVTQLTGAVSNDLTLSSPNSISSSLSTDLEAYTDESGQKDASSKAQENATKIKEIIEKNARVKKGLYKSLLASEDDFAVPTQQTVKTYKESVQPMIAMLIRKQQMRDAYINTIVDTEVQYKKDIVDLVSKKAVIMKSTFDSEAVSNEIDKLVD